MNTAEAGGTRAIALLTAIAALVPLTADAHTPARSPPIVSAGTLARSPPMGWNSWDAYGLTIDEADFKANAAVLDTIHPFGWTYAVIDEGWYMQNPSGEHLKDRNYQIDGHGLLVPAVNRFPSSKDGAGLRPLAEWLHAHGLKLGIHIVRGIPKQAVHDNLSVADSPFHASDVADTTDLCPWDEGNYGVRDNEAGQAYYNSMLELYARWDVDFLKVDCIADHPYRSSEIRQIAHAVEHAGRPMVLSLSPGPTQLAHADEVARYAQMWRISNDIWDGWSFAHQKPTDDFPNGIVTAFDNLARWARYARPGNWPDADMLPFGSLAPHPGWGEARQSRLSNEEEQTQFVLWAIAHSPLILGANLTHLDELTRSLLTNHDLIDLNQGEWTSGPFVDLPPGMNALRVWVATRGGSPGNPRSDSSKNERAIALFNLSDRELKVNSAWDRLGVPGVPHAITNLVTGKTLPNTRMLEITLPPHGSAAYRLTGVHSSGGGHSP